MSKTDWLKPLEQILNYPTRISIIHEEEWIQSISEAEMRSVANVGGDKPKPGERVEGSEGTWFVAETNEEELTILYVEQKQLSELEKELISWTLKNFDHNKEEKREENQTESEKFAQKLSVWIQKQLEADEPNYSLPDSLAVGSRLYHEMIPFLLVTEQSGSKKAAYTELEKLLRSFLSDDILLIPLKSQEWLIWGPLSLLKDEELDGYDYSEEESLEESLASIASGLHEMLTSEWIGECHLAVTHPVSPSQSMIETLITLRETVSLGRKFHIGTNIHLPWLMQLERLLNAIPETQRAKYLEQSLKRTDLFVEPEMLATLETFFSLDCNVSETAKKLYIHRNTLLYRLDKLKQETGLDVRLFRDAVLMKIILLLYKVTKRN
ncbi:helix-turn-helix domain-containing protein [Paenibacillus sp. HB172176]|uniref:PucR family transcriptional regulator n=1 Tax=Paenibacillus sp. HB172176 TaxID=2493690 RepID=UPI00143995E2|nr:helix-turn-helix domain-containing protein [Paenibacillus sp. HB172176]